MNKSGLLNFLTQMLKPIVVCIALADMVVLAIYGIVEPSRVVAEMAITTVITAIVSTPLPEAT